LAQNLLALFLPLTCSFLRLVAAVHFSIFAEIDAKAMIALRT
jgi:hypothetical protein